jgi:hypothetical protein
VDDQNAVITSQAAAAEAVARKDDPGTYFTPKEIVQPSLESGAFLVDLFKKHFPADDKPATLEDRMNVLIAENIRLRMCSHDKLVENLRERIRNLESDMQAELHQNERLTRERDEALVLVKRLTKTCGEMRTEREAMNPVSGRRWALRVLISPDFQYFLSGKNGQTVLFASRREANEFRRGLDLDMRRAYRSVQVHVAIREVPPHLNYEPSLNPHGPMEHDR